MGWSSGTEVFRRTWKAVRENIPEPVRVETCKKVIEAFQQADWDCEGDLEGEWPEFDEAYRQLYFEHFGSYPEDER